MNKDNSVISKKIYYKQLTLLFVLVVLSVSYMILLPDYSHHILFILGFGLIFFGSYLLFPYAASRKWNRNSAVVVDINESWREVSISEYTKIKYYFPEIKYQYEVNGEKYFSDRVSYNVKSIWIPEVDVWGGKISEEMKFWKSWSVGSVIDVFIDPACPSSSILVKKLSKNILFNYISIIVAGLILLCIWFILPL